MGCHSVQIKTSKRDLSPTALAMRTKAYLVPVYLLRDPDAPTHFTVHTIRVIDFNSVTYQEQHAIQTIDQDFEQIVRKYPEHWLQMYHARLG